MRKTVNKSISLPPSLMRRARKQAREKRQSFSGYLQSLIDRDLQSIPPQNGKAVAA